MGVRAAQDIAAHAARHIGSAQTRTGADEAGNQAREAKAFNRAVEPGNLSDFSASDMVKKTGRREERNSSYIYVDNPTSTRKRARTRACMLAHKPTRAPCVRTHARLCAHVHTTTCVQTHMRTALRVCGTLTECVRVWSDACMRVWVCVLVGLCSCV
jgi:hypothetical protein